MSRPSWQAALSKAIRRTETRATAPRIAVAGIGHELRGDDAAGLAVARGLQTALAGDERILVTEAGPVPENQTGLLRRFGPDLVLLVDAAQMDAVPGTVQWLRWEDTAGLTAATHSLPLSVLARYLRGELDCEVALLGIQPADDSIGVPLSPRVAEAVKGIVEVLAGKLEGKAEPRPVRSLGL
jgi:hydrogenase 3 maturation protease